jgi:hypothetical protein
MNADRLMTEEIAASIRGFTCSYCSRNATRRMTVGPD